MGKLLVLREIPQSFEWDSSSLQQRFSQAAKLSGHLDERILFNFAAIPGKQLKFGATEITAGQMTLNLSQAFRVHKRAAKREQCPGGGARGRLAKQASECRSHGLISVDPPLGYQHKRINGFRFPEFSHSLSTVFSKPVNGLRGV